MFGLKSIVAAAVLLGGAALGMAGSRGENLERVGIDEASKLFGGACPYAYDKVLCSSLQTHPSQNCPTRFCMKLKPGNIIEEPRQSDIWKACVECGQLWLETNLTFCHGGN